jgi:hypothetical protein
MSNQNSEIDSIIEELKADAVPSEPKVYKNDNAETVTDENVGDYVYKKSAELVESTLGAVQSLKDNVLTGSDPKEIAALSQLINSATKALDQLNKINLQNKQEKSNKEIKKMEIEANSKLPKLPQQTNVLIATRDEIMSQLFDKGAKKSIKDDIIEGNYERLE